MKLKMWITTTALCLVALFLALFAGTVQAVATDITGISLSVQENTTAAGRAVALPEGDAVYSYSLACITPGADDTLFNIAAGGNLTFKTAPNYEVKSVYDVCVRATDVGDASIYDKNFTITVTDVVTEPELLITVNGENIALVHSGHTDYYGVAVGYNLTGADVTPANVRQVTVVLKDALNNKLHTMVTSDPAHATAAQSGGFGQYTAPFAVKMGSKTTSGTWGATYTDRWPGGDAVPGKPAASAVVTLEDINHTFYTTTITGLSGDPVDLAAGWAGLFPSFKYTAGTGGTLTGNLSQTVAWYGIGATGSAVTAVPDTDNYFSGWSDAVATATRTDTVPPTANIAAYSGVDVTANFATPDITVNGENIALVKTGHTDYYGVAVGYNLAGADVAAGNIVSVTVGLKDAGGNILHTMATSSSSVGQFTAPFPVKMGSKTTSGTWGATYTDQWSGGPAVPNNPAVSAVVTVLDKWGLSHSKTITGLSGDPVDVSAGWAGLFPSFKYTAGTGGSLTGVSPQTIAWYGIGATGSTVTAVPNTLYYFSGWNDAVATAGRTDTVPPTANIATYSGVDVTANFILLKTISGTISHSGLLAGGTTIKFDTAGTDYPGTINLSTGAYTITGIPGGTVGDIVPAFYGGGGYTFTPPSITGVTITGDLPGQNFTATGARTISGTISGPGGARLPVGAVLDFGSGMTFTQGAGTTTGYSFSGLAPKNYRMGFLNITYPGSFPFLNNRIYLGVSPMPSKPPTSAPTFNFATTIYGDDTIGNDFMYFWTPFTLTGPIKTPLGANPALKAFNISLVGTGTFAGQSLKGTYNASNSTFTINTPFTKIGSTITPAAFTGNLLITGTGYQTFTPLGSYTMTASQVAPNVTAYGDRAIYGQFTAGLVPPDGTVIDFGGGLTSTVEDGGWFYLPNLERKSYTLKPITEGYFFTANAAGTTQVSITANLSSANSDLSGKFFGKAAPILTFPLNGSVQNSGASVTFNWSAPAGATQYKMEYATNAAFSSGKVTSPFIAVTNYRPASFVDNSPDKTYYWRVTAYDSAGKVLGTSLAWTFTR